MLPNPSLRNHKESKLKKRAQRTKCFILVMGHRRRFAVILSIYGDVQEVYMRLQFALYLSKRVT